MNYPKNQRRAIVDTQYTHLIVFRRKLVQALLDNMIPFQVLDQHHDMVTKRDDNRVYLSIVSMISLRSRRVSEGERTSGATLLACLRVDKRSIIFCTARVPCMFSEM